MTRPGIKRIGRKTRRRTTEMPEKATECHECGNTHDDWSKDGQHAVSDPHNEGMVERWECGVCGAITEVPRY